MSVPRLGVETGIRNNRLDLLLKVLAVEGAVRRTTDGWAPTGALWTYDRERYAALLAAREHESGLMRSYARSLRCLDSVLRESLDDPALDSCGRCSACTGSLPEGLSREPDREHTAAALAHVRGLDVVLEPRKMWAPGLPWSGRITAAVSIDRGRALAFADDPAWPEARALVESADGPAPGWVVDALVATLARWGASWPGRPTVVVPVPGVRHPLRVRSLADAVGGIGRIPVVDALGIAGTPTSADIAAKARAAFQAGRLSLLPGVDVVGETVLLVDDRWQTGWTATIAGAILREAGAERVLPLVIHQQP